MKLKLTERFINGLFIGFIIGGFVGILILDHIIHKGNLVIKKNPYTILEMSVRGGTMKIVLEMDENTIFAHWDDFVNIQESPCGYGYTVREAVEALLKDDPDRSNLDNVD